jgi:hypothetical protein
MLIELFLVCLTSCSQIDQYKLEQEVQILKKQVDSLESLVDTAIDLPIQRRRSIFPNTPYFNQVCQLEEFPLSNEITLSIGMTGVLEKAYDLLLKDYLLNMDTVAELPRYYHRPVFVLENSLIVNCYRSKHGEVLFEFIGLCEQCYYDPAKHGETQTIEKQVYRIIEWSPLDKSFGISSVFMYDSSIVILAEYTANNSTVEYPIFVFTAEKASHGNYGSTVYVECTDIWNELAKYQIKSYEEFVLLIEQKDISLNCSSSKH